MSFLLDLAVVVRECTLVGFSVGLDAKHYRSLPKSKRQHGISEPHVACLQRMLRMVRDRLRAENYQQKITFVIDRKREAWSRYTKTYSSCEIRRIATSASM
jgi:hypothetical protein